MLTTSSTAVAVGAILLGATSIDAMPLLAAREPHFGEIISPNASYVLLANDSSPNATLAFHYLNGGRYDNTTCTISLQNETATYTLASDVLFYGSYSVNATLDIFFSVVADGNYTFIVQEMLDGEVTSEVTQPFAVSHNASTPAPSGSQEVINPYATSTAASASVGTVYVPANMQATVSSSAEASTATAPPEPTTINLASVLSELAANLTMSTAA